MPSYRAFLPCLVAAASALSFVGPKPVPRVFSPGHYCLADGVRHQGQLCLVSDNELLVKSADTARPRLFAAVEVKNFVIAADSFTVLRNIDLVVNEVITRYSSTMVQVCLPGHALRLYRLRGAMDVLAKTMDPFAKNVLRGVSGGALGIAGGLLADDLARTPANGFKEQTMTLMLLQLPGGAVETLQPKTPQARVRIEAAIADNAELSKRVHRTNSMYLTDERILEIFGQYFAGSASTGP